MKTLYLFLLNLICITQAAKMDDRFVMQYPLRNATFKHWKATGSAVFLENNAILAPELLNAQGMIYAKHVSLIFLIYLSLDFQLARL